MLNTMSSETANFINPELTWNKVSKGSRSSYRRPRNPGRNLNADAQQDEKSIQKEEASVSESEKLGVAVLGRRFIDKIEHVPIKKRRFPLPSPSPSPPPRTPSPLNEESLSSEPQTPSLQAEDSASGLWCRSDSMSNQEMGTFCDPIAVQLSQGNNNGFVNGKLSEVTDIKLGYQEDFSGIQLLAAAARNDSIDDDPHNVKDGPIVDDSLTPKGTDGLVSASSLERAMTSSESGNTFQRSSEYEDEILGLKVQDTNVVVPESSHDKIDSAGKMSVRKKDDRLHWDLNTFMEAWNRPSDDLGSPRIGLEGVPDDDVDGEKPENLGGSVMGRDPEHTVELSKCSAETEVSTQASGKDKFLHSFSRPGSDHISSGPLLVEKIDTSLTNIVMHTREDSCRTSSIEAESDQLEKRGNVHLEGAAPEKVVSEIDSMLSKEDSRKTIELPHNGTSPTEFVAIVTSETMVVEYSTGKTAKSRSSNPSPARDTLSASGTTFGGCEPVVADDMEQKEDKEAPAADATPVDSFSHVERKKMPNSYECQGKAVLEDPVDDGYGSDVSHGGQGQMVGVEKMTEIQAGYESPFEDGELRESFVFSWEQNEAEGDAECVDYDSDDRDGDDYDGGNICMSGVGSDSCQNEDNGSSTEKVMLQGRPIVMDDSSLASLKESPEQDPLRDGCNSSTNRSGEANNYSTQKNLARDSMDGLDVKGSAGEVGLRVLREKVVSLTEEPSCSDSQLREEKLYIPRNRYSYDSFIQSGRVFASDKSWGRGKGGSQGEGHWVDCYYDDSQGTGDPRSRVVIANSAAKVDGLPYRDQRRPMHYSSKGFHQPRMGRRALADSDNSFSVHGRRAAGRDGSLIRSRGRSGVYRQAFSRGPREEYHGPTPDNPASSVVRQPHYLARRDRSFSPDLCRGASFSRPRRKSRSRSRSRSPLPWHLQRERDMAPRRLSRSPDFRSDTRMERVRMPFQKSNFVEEDEFFVSPPRRRFSPLSHPRWIDNGNCNAPHFRDRKSPGRLSVRNPRFHSGGSPGRTKSDDCFRPSTRPGRFTERSVGAGRGHRYGGSDCERMKYRDRSEMIPRLRRYDSSRVLNRFRQDGEDCFEVHNTRNGEHRTRSVDKRDVPVSAREERGPFRYNNGRMYASGPKLSGN